MQSKIESSPIKVDRTGPTLSEFSSSLNGGSRVSPLGVARPRSVAEIEKLIKWANKEGISLVPSSSKSGPRLRRSTNVTSQSLIVDLSQNDKMVHADEENRITILEPGVTFGMVDDLLRPYSIRSFKPLLPRKNKSVLSAFLEREPTTSSYDHWDSSDPLASLELVFGSGEKFRTGGAAAPGSLEKNLENKLRQMMSVGPSVTDFTRVFQGAQGSVGVACWGSLYCEPLPPIERAYFVPSDDLTALTELAYKFCWRRTSGQMFIMNRAQLALILSATGQDFGQALSSLPGWVMFTNFTAAPNFPEEHLAYVLNDFDTDAAEFGLKKIDQISSVLADEFNVLLQTPQDDDYKTCGIGEYDDFCFLTQLDKTQSFADVLSANSASSSGGQTAIYIQPMVHGVSCHMDVTLLGQPSENRQAALDGAVEACRQNGAFFSRPYKPWGAAAFKSAPETDYKIQIIKNILDPNGVMNPECFSYAQS